MHIPTQTKTKPSSFTPVSTILLQRKCASCGQYKIAGEECSKCSQRQSLQRYSQEKTQSTEAPPIVNEVLNSPGQPLDPTTRGLMESRFAQNFSQVQIHSKAPTIAHSSLAINQPGDASEQEADSISGNVMRTSAQSTQSIFEPNSEFDFSRVRVHTDTQADQSARAINARAYTVGTNIVFQNAQYQPNTTEGLRLLSHELVHVLQQSGTAGLTPAKHNIQRWSFQEFKQGVYNKLIEQARQERTRSINFLRNQVVKRLPESQHNAANTLIDVIDVVYDLLIQVDFAIIGMLVGFGEGIVGTVVGLVKLTYGIIKLLVDLVLGIFDNWETFGNDIDAIANGLRNIIPGMRKIVADWLERFKKSSPEQGTFMIGELFGQIEALILTWHVAATKAAQAPKLAVPTVRFEKAVTTTGELATVPVVATTPVNVATPAAAAGLVGAPAMMMQGGNGGGGGGSKETPKNKDQGEPAKTESQESSEVTPTIKQVYNSLKDSPQYPKDFRLVQNGTRKLSIKNKQLLEELRKIEPGEWNKIYKDGYSGGDRVSIHYFQSKSGKVFNVKVKSGWSNQE